MHFCRALCIPHLPPKPRARAMDAPSSRNDGGGEIDAFAAAVTERVLSEVQSDPRMEQPSLYTATMGFVHAVDWSEYWLQALLATHVVLLLLVIATRRRFWLQVGIFLGISAAVRAAEPLNSFAHEHWRRFARQDYFGRNGTFMAVVYCAPLLLILLVQLVRCVWSCEVLACRASVPHSLVRPYPWLRARGRSSSWSVLQQCLCS